MDSEVSNIANKRLAKTMKHILLLSLTLEITFICK